MLTRSRMTRRGRLAAAVLVVSGLVAAGTGAASAGTDTTTPSDEGTTPSEGTVMHDTFRRARHPPVRVRSSA